MKLLELPYKSREVSMLVGPAAPRVESVSIRLSRFEARVGWKLVTPLKALELVSAFTNNADLRGMVEGKPLMIDSVVQEAMVKVGEEGTVAAAVASVRMR